MKYTPSAQLQPMYRFAAGWLLLLALLLVPLKAVFSQTPAEYRFTLTNRTDTRITKIVLAPYNSIQIHTTTSLAPGESIVITRPACKKMKVEITHARGRFLFQMMNFANEKDTAFSLMVRKDTVPILRADNRRRGDITGDNADWRFTQILGSMPFSIGATTMAEALALGANPDKNKDELETTLLWGNRQWKLTLVFAGTATNSILRRIEMVAKGAPGHAPSAVHEALMSHGYVYYSMNAGKKIPKELYVTVPLARALENANMRGRSLAAVLAAHSSEVVVQSHPGRGMWIVNMTRAPDLVKGR
ncbi:MAG: hypothetical protein LBM56_05920 [Burkholderiaceae bacterium]|nr:hypothetical protein [Burkholderiaceae bacterium]